MRSPCAIARRFSKIALTASVLAVSVSINVRAQEPDRLSLDKQGFAAQVREIRESAATPEEAVARVDALLRAHPRGRAMDRREAKEVPRPPKPPVSTQGLSEEDALRLEVRNVLNATRKAATTPEEEVALVDEFLRLNAEALASLRPEPPSEAEKTAAEQARKRRLQDRLAADPEDVHAQAALVLWQIRSQARSPEKSVALTDEFLRLNRETLDAARDYRSPNPTEK